MNNERYAKVMEASADMTFALALPAEGIGVILAALRLLAIHPEYVDLSLTMRAIVVHHRNKCRALMMEMGFTREEVDYLDSEKKPIEKDDPERSLKAGFRLWRSAITAERMNEVYQSQFGQYFRIDVDNVCVSVLHGAVILMNAHPEGGGKSRAYRDLVRAIRDLLLDCYLSMGFSVDEAEYMDTWFEDGPKSVDIRSARPIYYIYGKEVRDVGNAEGMPGQPDEGEAEDRQV